MFDSRTLTAISERAFLALLLVAVLLSSVLVACVRADNASTVNITVYDESGFPAASAGGFTKLAEVQVRMYDTNGNLVASGRSGDDGTLTFNLDPGVYTVQYGGCLYRSIAAPYSTDLTTYAACLPDSRQVTISKGANQLSLYVAELSFHVYESGSDGGNPFQLDYLDMNSSASDHETTITVSPGQTVQAVASFWELETINVPVWYASAFGDWNPTAALANLAEGCASPSSHALYTVPFTFTAPTQPGTYDIRLNGALDYDWCNSYYTGNHPNPSLGRDMGNSIISNVSVDPQTRAISGTYGVGTVIVKGFVPPLAEGRLAIRLSGAFDYLSSEGITIEIAALVTNATTLDPVSGANVTITITNPKGLVWLSDRMIQRSPGVYVWESSQAVKDVVAEQGAGIYLVQAEASFSGHKNSTDVLLFRIDASSPPSALLGVANAGQLFAIGGIAGLAIALTATLAYAVKKRRR
jgi:hypothetical protein